MLREVGIKAASLLAARDAPVAPSIAESSVITSAGSRVLIAATVGIAYYAGAQIGFLLKLPPGTPSALWPPNAILMATLLLLRPRDWWIALLAAVPGHLAVELRAGWPMPLVVRALRHQLQRSLDRRARRAPAERRARALRLAPAHGGVHRGGRAAGADHLLVRGRGGRLDVPRRLLLGRVARAHVGQHPHRPDAGARAHCGRPRRTPLVRHGIAARASRGGDSRDRRRCSSSA